MPPKPNRSRFFPVEDFDLDGTLDSGQAFRWKKTARGWEGVIGRKWVCLNAVKGGLQAETARPKAHWAWLADYLQIEVGGGRGMGSLGYRERMGRFPKDRALQGAVKACPGLRLLRQEPWECLASFILSSTKQIVQIRQIVDTLCERYGEPVPVPTGVEPWNAFPTARSLAKRTEGQLRSCKAGFRAPYLLRSARLVAAGKPDLGRLSSRPLEEAREALMELPGVGRKIADCVLLFSLGFRQVFPVDTWILRALRGLYFPGRNPSPDELRRFADSHFGPEAGFAQQFLFHAIRTGRLEAGVPKTTRRSGKPKGIQETRE